MKRLISLFLAVFSMLALMLPAHATLTYATPGGTRYGDNTVILNYIKATANDTTASVNGNPIDNVRGSIIGISASFVATNQTGTSPTVQLTLQGSDDGTNYYTINSNASSPAALQTSAVSISSASTTTVVAGFQTDMYNRKGIFPAYLRLNIAIGGSSTPGWTGTVAISVRRSGATFPLANY